MYSSSFSGEKFISDNTDAMGRGMADAVGDTY